MVTTVKFWDLGVDKAKVIYFTSSCLIFAFNEDIES